MHMHWPYDIHVYYVRIAAAIRAQERIMMHDIVITDTCMNNHDLAHNSSHMTTMKSQSTLAIIIKLIMISILQVCHVT